MTQITEGLISKIDGSGMWDLIKSFPDHWKEISDQTRDHDFKVDASAINNICMSGMGGSAIGADLIRAYSYNTCPVPVQIVRHYDIPNWVNENTLFVACSFSGNTEETLSALDQAHKAGAQCFAVTSGGSLLIQANEMDFDYIKIPGGMPPRAALAYSFVPLFRLFQYLGYLDEGEEALTETQEYLANEVDLLANYEENNEAKALAGDIKDTLPVIYSDARMLDPVHLRWRGQFEENAKTLAYGNVLPEMNHNEIVGWEQIAHLAGRLSVIFLRDAEDNERVQKRMEVTRELVQEQAVSLHVLDSRGQSRLTRLFSLIQMADWTSIYLALLTETDPTPIAPIDLLKSKLAEL